jgi:hypothetical protein
MSGTISWRVGGFGFSGFFGFAQQEKQAKPNKLEKPA